MAGFSSTSPPSTPFSVLPILKSVFGSLSFFSFFSFSGSFTCIDYFFCHYFIFSAILSFALLALLFLLISSSSGTNGFVLMALKETEWVSIKIFFKNSLKISCFDKVFHQPVFQRVVRNYYQPASNHLTFPVIGQAYLSERLIHHSPQCAMPGKASPETYFVCVVGKHFSTASTNSLVVLIGAISRLLMIAFVTW